MPGLQKKTTKKEEILNRDDLIFALDIGTRTVVGIVGYYENECFKVVAAEISEHKSRAMLDGQIHDIGKVAVVVSEVKSKLEKTLGFTLTQVAIAAAGRVLRTSQVKLDYEIDQGREISQEIVGSLEVDAVQKAQIQLDNEFSNEDRVPFYCVGYSVVNYFLNGYVISSLVGHKGKKIGVEVLATFLPYVVIDSLYTVMSKVGLEVVSLTLEPIAAISVTIPKDLRLLNLVLVDIGAGTSDIAVTKDGSVVAYGMVPIAGDEITERIAQEFLLDFNTAEKVKISISSEADTIKFTDILGKKCEISCNKAFEAIQPAVDLLAGSICERIMEFNLKTPNAVFLIGGGSQIPGLTDKIADGLGLHRERVVVRGRDIIHNIKTKIKKLSGPESITPFGIAMMAYTKRGQDFTSVIVNGNKVRLFNSKKLTVADAFILIGYNPDMLLGRSGKALKFTLNGRQVSVKGELGIAAEIYVNNSPASLDTEIKMGDSINVNPAHNGNVARKYINDYIKNPEGLRILFNGEEFKLLPDVSVNGKECSASYEIKENDSLKIDEVITLSDLTVKFELKLKDCELLVNDDSKSLDYILKNNDAIKYSRINTDILNRTKDPEEVQGLIVDDNIDVDKTETDSSVKNSNSFEIYINGDKVSLNADKSYIFVDVFSYINFDLTIPKGNIVLKLNGRSANFTDTIHPGDSIEIYWENFKV